MIPSARNCAIVADGPSAFPLLRRQIPPGVFVIAINAAVRWLPRVDAFFTLDPDSRIRELMESPRPGVEYFAAVPEDYGSPVAQCAAHRVQRLPHVCYLSRIAGDGPLGSAPGLSDRQGVIHTGNSAYGGLGLAKLLGAENVALFGVDGSRRRVSGGNSRALGHLPWLFSTVDEPDMKIRTASMASTVTAFPKMRLPAALDWLASA